MISRDTGYITVFICLAQKVRDLYKALVSLGNTLFNIEKSEINNIQINKGIVGRIGKFSLVLGIVEVLLKSQFTIQSGYGIKIASDQILLVKEQIRIKNYALIRILNKGKMIDYTAYISFFGSYVEKYISRS